MNRVDILTEQSLNVDAYEFRASIFPHVYRNDNFLEVEREIDENSIHIIFQNSNNIVAYARITSPAFNVFSYFTDCNRIVPNTSQTWSLGRGAVAEEVRGAGLLIAVCLEGLNQCRKHGATHVVGAVPPSDKAFVSIQKSLMSPVGPVVLSGHLNQKSPHQIVIHTCSDYTDDEVVSKRDNAIQNAIMVLSKKR